jgi:alpha-mannosidase
MQDIAKYEVPGHKWIDLSEHGFGVALLNDCKYGFSTRDNTMRISLLRATKSPDPEADMGHHEFSYAVLPHAGGWREAGVVAEGYRFNAPLLWANAPIPEYSFASVDDDNLVLDTIKKAEDSDAVVLRLYEAHGARGTAKVKIGVPFTRAVRCNILEEEGEALTVQGGMVTVPYTPFQLVSLKVL